jgi:hypothetical protein
MSSIDASSINSNIYGGMSIIQMPSLKMFFFQILPAIILAAAVIYTIITGTTRGF